ncbi:hypothetical protein GTA51_13085 [Desulfovibrio aerotolerans]|uniref:Uncharacterized protein n=1 Tax=Solidesulfovibrio aerotolerans TaxID=295255 RepID=A0A7C9IVN1_9BACT|nr:GGDEF domain-containing protein [Solidesulfovibrio aerotolerans]MYL84063.1 hypothetical protein [Solidesulfovibrio aerotolerans]
MSDITKQKLTEQMLEEYRDKLEQLSLTDARTKIQYWRKFNEIFDQEYARHARTKAELSPFMLGMDFFKA